MIYEIKVNNTSPDESVLPWWEAAPFLKGKTIIPFTAGLNILYGPNGSGKSTIIRAIARSLACEQGGVQAVTHDYAWHMRRGRGDGIRAGQVPVHDGSPIVYFGADDVVGLFGGGFDEDFFSEGVSAAAFKGSTGQRLTSRLGTIAAAAKGQFPEIRNASELERHKELKALLLGEGPKVCPTILMDEPTRSLEMFHDILVLRLAVSATRRGIQVIIATHSPVVALASDLTDANFIETSPGYLTYCKLLLGKVSTDWEGLIANIQQSIPPHMAVGKPREGKDE